MDHNRLAAEAHDALTSADAIPPFSARGDQLTDADAYAVVAALRKLRGDKVVGRKIGFTNRGIWPLYNIHQPIWGDVTEATLLVPGEPVVATRYSEPRLEPEIVLHLCRTPEPGMDEAALATCVDWAAPGFEVVQSIYPGWRFETSDTIIAGGLHGGLMIGEQVNATPEVLAALCAVSVTLASDGVKMDEGVGANALDGPLSALRHLNDLLMGDPDNPPLAAGEVITTGTLTDAFPVAAGQTWTAAYTDVLQSDLAIQFI